MNKVCLIGRLTKDVQLKKTQSGKSVVQFSIAVNRDKETSDFISCVAWNQTAELISNYFHKGNQIGIEGKITTRNYDDPNVPNKKVFVTEVLVDNITFLDKKDTKQEVEEVKEEVRQTPYGMNITADDLPF